MEEGDSNTYEYLIYQAGENADILNWILQAESDGVDLSDLAKFIADGGSFEEYLGETPIEAEN